MIFQMIGVGVGLVFAKSSVGDVTVTVLFGVGGYLVGEYVHVFFEGRATSARAVGGVAISFCYRHLRLQT